MEIVNKASPNLDKHIQALENRVDKLTADNLKLKKKLQKATSAPSKFITQEQYDKVLVQLQAYWDKETPSNV